MDFHSVTEIVLWCTFVVLYSIVKLLEDNKYYNISSSYSMQGYFYEIKNSKIYI